MTHGGFNRRFLETTRGQVVALLRRGPQTVDELARALGLTDNGVRTHLATLERDGIVRQGGVRRGEGAGKPATLYELAPEAETLFSRAYVPVLVALLEEMIERLPPEQNVALLEGMGRRLAAGVAPVAAAGLDARLQAAVGVLNGLGGAAEIEERDGIRLIRGCGCPLSAAVSRRPELCAGVAALLGEVVGAEVRHCCRQGDRPSCCFEIEPAA
jgi:predicted ArsR family transcriptional regulator